VGRPSAPVEEKRSSLRTDPAGSDALVFAESIARRFLRALAPGRGAIGPSRRALRPSGRECVSQFSFGRAVVPFGGLVRRV